MRYNVKDPQGQMHIIEGPDGATPDQVIVQAQKLIPSQKMGGKLPFGELAKFVGGTLPQVQLGKSIARNPQMALPIAGTALGGMLGGPPGMAAGAGLGQIGSRMIDIKRGSPVGTPFQESLGPMAQTAMGGLPEVLGFMKAGPTTLAQKIGQQLGKTGEFFTGLKKGDLGNVSKEGFNIYKAPSLPKAQKIFGMALGPEGNAAMKQTASEAFDSALGKARQTAVEIGTKIENGEPVTAIEALKARQATDRVISATPETDKVARDALYKWRSTFDDQMTSQSGKLKAASTMYRRSLLKDRIMNPTRITKSGRPSAFLPMVLGAGGRGLGGAMAGLSGTSPMLWGAGSATLGSMNPTMVQSAVAGAIQKMLQSNRQSSPEQEQQ